MAALRSEVKTYGGKPTVFINGEPVTGLMHWTRNPTVADTAFFRDAGVHFHSFMGNLEVLPPEDVPPEELEFHDGGLERMLLTPENIDRTMSMLVQTDPGILVLPRFIMNPPVWWERRHPEELMVYYHLASGKYLRGPRASLASEKWKAAWQCALRRTVRYFEEHWGEHVFGYHTGLGHCGEHACQWWDVAADFNPQNAEAFRKWLRRRYGNAAALNAAWRSTWADFDSVPLPEGRAFADFGPRAKALFLPESEQALMDFQEFISDEMAQTLLEEAHTVKEELAALGSVKLYGAFYGYVNLVANSTQCTVGHSALTQVLESPEVDFLCGPLSYGARQNGGVALPQMIPDSITLHGKVFYNEDDTGTHLYAGPHHGYLPSTAEDSVQAERRNFLETWSRGGTQWWMDLYGKEWFLAPELQCEFRRLRTFAERHLADRETGGAQIAVFVSLGSSLCMRDTPVPLTGNLIEQQLFEIAACGAPFDLFQAEDLPQLVASGRLSSCRLCIFPNLLAPSPAVREAIEGHLKGQGRTLLWFYMPGYFSGYAQSASAAEKLSGIRFSAVPEGIMPMLTEFWRDGNRFVYGLTRAVYPRFSADDPQAEVHGYYVNGTTVAGRPHGSGAALVEKQFGAWRSVWSSSPGLPSSEITRIAAAAGVHIYSSCGDQVFCGANWIGVHAKCDGPLELKLPEARAYRQFDTGTEYPAGDTLRLNARRGQTVLLESIPV